MAIRTIFWALSGAVVVVFVLLAALERIDPSDAWPLTAGVLLLAVLLLAHEWRELWLDERKWRSF